MVVINCILAVSVIRRKVQRKNVGSETKKELLGPKLAKENKYNDPEFELSFVTITHTCEPLSISNLQRRLSLCSFHILYLRVEVSSLNKTVHQIAADPYYELLYSDVGWNFRRDLVFINRVIRLNKEPNRCWKLICVDNRIHGHHVDCIYIDEVSEVWFQTSRGAAPLLPQCTGA